MNEQVKEIVALHKKICRKAGVTIRDHQMLEPGDNILLGLSGGKDSMIMLEVMAERRASLPFNFDLTAAHIHIETAGYTVNRVAMESLCQKLNVPFVWKEAEIEPVGKKEKGICFLCSWNRRKSLFDLARELDAGKLALGHHRYDALETMLINMIYHGSISSLPHKLSMFDGRMQLIRPLLDMDENLLADYAGKRDFQTGGEKCRHVGNNQREWISELIAYIEKNHETGAINMFRSMGKIFEEYLPQKKARTS